MNFRGLIFSLIGLVGVVLGIFFAVRTFRNKGKEPRVTEVERTMEECNFPLLRAVPSDAAAILSFDGGADAAYWLTDSASVVPPLVSGIPARLLRSVSSRKLAVSLHDAGGLTPLLVVEMAGADSAELYTTLHLADTLSLRSRYVEGEAICLISPSETLVGSAERHLEGGFSVLDNRDLLSATAALPYGNAVFLSHGSANRLIRTFLASSFASYASFFSKTAVWSALALPRKDAMRAEGLSANFGNTCYLSILSGTASGEFKFPDVVPVEAAGVTALAMDTPEPYITLRRRWLDACGRLSAYKDANSRAKKALGQTAEQYLVRYGLQEAVSAVLPSGERLVALRYREKPEGGKDIQPYNAGYALSMLFGEMFRPQGDSLWSCLKGDWKWIGSRDALSLCGGPSLKRSPDAGALIPGSGVFVHYVADGHPAEVLAPAYAAPVRRRLRGASSVAFCFAAEPVEGGVRYAWAYAPAQRVPKPSPSPASQPSASASEPAVAEPSAVLAEYPVKNFRTGKMNTFFQRRDGRIGLRDESGSVLWTLPFEGTVPGVAEVDYYGNGKIQYLFASGSRLYIIDVLGRFVPSFEVDLGKEVLLGPDAYHFGDDDDAWMVLHRDNTLSLYRPDGSLYPHWKNIAPKEPVSALPEMVEVEGERYWKVAFASGEKYYRFGGGSPLSNRKTRKLLKKTVLKSE